MLNIYIYIYIYVCVCVCVYTRCSFLMIQPNILKTKPSIQKCFRQKLFSPNG